MLRRRDVLGIKKAPRPGFSPGRVPLKRISMCAPLPSPTAGSESGREVGDADQLHVQHEHLAALPQRTGAHQLHRLGMVMK